MLPCSSCLGNVTRSVFSGICKSPWKNSNDPSRPPSSPLPLPSPPSFRFPVLTVVEQKDEITGLSRKLRETQEEVLILSSQLESSQGEALRITGQIPIWSTRHPKCTA